MGEEKKTTGFSKVGIVGLGLIGGSLAKAIHGKTDVKEIVAIDTDPKAGELASSEGVIVNFSTNDLSILDGSDLVILCAPVDAIKKMQPELSKLNIGLITDVGSVKAPVMEAISDCCAAFAADGLCGRLRKDRGRHSAHRASKIRIQRKRSPRRARRLQNRTRALRDSGNHARQPRRRRPFTNGGRRI